MTDNSTAFLGSVSRTIRGGLVGALVAVPVSLWELVIQGRSRSVLPSLGVLLLILSLLTGATCAALPARIFEHLMLFFKCLIRVVIGSAVGSWIGIPLFLLCRATGAFYGIPFALFLGALGGFIGAIAGAVIWTRRTKLLPAYRRIVSIAALALFCTISYLIWFFLTVLDHVLFQSS
jgi:hypothetical protein